MSLLSQLYIASCFNLFVFIFLIKILTAENGHYLFCLRKLLDSNNVNSVIRDYLLCVLAFANIALKCFIK